VVGIDQSNRRRREGDVKPVDQTTFGFPDGNCLAASLASVVELPLEVIDVPLRTEWAGGGHWMEGVYHVLAAHGFEGWHRGPDNPPGGYAVAFGPAARGFSHACVVLNGALAHDPHPSRDGLLNVSGYIAIKVAA
jgi:hypothetical protein